LNASIAQSILEASQILRKASVPDARREAGSLMSHVLGRDRTFIISHAEDAISEDDLKLFLEQVRRRATGEPLQYITGHQEFFGLDFEVTADVLIPRPETELLVETAIQLMDGAVTPFLCDVGTGSGCIAISLVHALTSARAVATDISAAALEVAKRNAEQLQVQDRMSLIVSDCFAALPPELKFDLIVSNPPYVALNAVDGLQREVRNFEPRLALTSGADGLSVIRRLLTEAGDFLKPGGHLLIEIGFDQHEAVGTLIDPQSWKLLDIHPDLQGIPRVVALQKISE
jgi:release factor glutamine methyltransferase